MDECILRRFGPRRNRAGVRPRFSWQNGPAMDDITQWHARVGGEIGVSPWFDIDQDRSDQFARAIVDPHWIHVDLEWVTRQYS